MLSSRCFPDKRNPVTQTHLDTHTHTELEESWAGIKTSAKQSHASCLPVELPSAPLNGLLLCCVVTACLPRPFGFFLNYRPCLIFSPSSTWKWWGGLIACLNRSPSAGPCVAWGSSSCWVTTEETERCCSSLLLLCRGGRSKGRLTQGEASSALLVVSTPSVLGYKTNSGSCSIKRHFIYCTGWYCSKSACYSEIRCQ